MARAQAPNTRLLWRGLAKVFLNTSILRVAKETENHWRLQFEKIRATPVTRAPTIKVSKRWGDWKSVSGNVAYIEIWDEPRQWWREPRDGEEGIPAEKMGVTRRIIIKIYKPREVRDEPRYVVVIDGFDGKSTKVGSFREVTVAAVDDKVFDWHFRAYSRGGTHWFDYYVVIAKRVVFHDYYVSSRGNVTDHVIVYAPEGVRTLPRLETVKRLASNGVIEYAIVRNNVSGEEFEAVLLCARGRDRGIVATMYTIDAEGAELREVGVDANGCRVYRVARKNGEARVAVKKTIITPIKMLEETVAELRL